MPSVRVTRGRLTALWLVLRTLDELGGRAETSDLRAAARRSGLRGGGLPVPDGIRLAREGGFMSESAGVCALEPPGERALALSAEEEPPMEIVRLFVTVLFLQRPPAWVAWWQGSPADFEAVVPPTEQEVLRDAGLLPHPPVEDPGGWAWWQALGRVPLPEQTAISRKQIGDAGEALSVEYERARLSAQGCPELAADVAWVARESDAYGFDVLSYAGKDFALLEPDDRIAIEVKSTALPVIEVFPLYFTAHEWEVACGLGPRSVLHLWASVDPGPPPHSRTGTPVVLSTSSLAEHLPAPPACGESCSWQTAHLNLQII